MFLDYVFGVGVVDESIINLLNNYLQYVAEYDEQYRGFFEDPLEYLLEVV